MGRRGAHPLRLGHRREGATGNIDVWERGSASRDFIYVDDAAEGIVLAAEKYYGPEPVKLGVGEEITVRDLVTLTADITGFTGEIRWYPTRPDGQTRWVLDTSRASERFGFVARAPWKYDLQATIEWYESKRRAVS